jgi:hypothetical protein
VRLLNVLLAIIYAGLALGTAYILVLGVAYACEGNRCTETGTWVETGEGWQWDVIAYVGLASFPVVFLALVLTYVRWWLGAAFVATHLALLAAALPFAGQQSTYRFVLVWYGVVVAAGFGFVATRRALSERSIGALDTPASRSA